MNSPLQFVVLGPSGPELTSTQPAGIRLLRKWGVWWFDHDHPSNTRWPSFDKMKAIGEDFIAREPDDHGVMGVFCATNDDHRLKANRFCDEYRTAHQKSRRTSRSECVAANCFLAAQG